jgi:hypothetical protein
VTHGKHIARDAAALSALPATSLERAAAEAHGRGCAECARALREGARVVDLIDQRLELPPPSRRALRRAHLRVRRAAALQMAVPAAGIPLLFAAGIALLRGSTSAGDRWAAAAALAALSMLLCWAAASGRAIRWTLLATTGCSIAFAAALARRGPLAPVLGVRCALIEIAPALTGLAVAAALTHTWRVLLRERWRAVALLATGGLTVQAALLVVCPGRAGAEHVLLFHSGGLLAVCALCALLAPRLAPTFPTQA